MNAPRNAYMLARAYTRAFSQTTTKNSEELPSRIVKLRENQKRFGIEDNTPVYLKGGVTDRLLYLGTVGIIAVGLGMTLETFYTLTFKK